MKGAPTLNDVAREAKVSRSLASLVFQGSPKVSDEKRAAVLKAAEKLGYLPNESARRLKSSVTKTIGVLLTDIHNPYYGQIFYGIESSASKIDYKLLIGNSGFDSDVLNQTPKLLGARQLETLRTVRRQMVDGILCSTLRATPDELAAAAATTPLVLVGHSKKELIAKYDSVISDERYSASEIISHLSQYKHKRITHISGGSDTGPSIRSREYLAAMKKAGLAAYAEVIPGEWSQEAGYEATSQILKKKVLPTAIYAANDLIAMGVLARLQEANISVPGDISVVGYDDSELAQLRIADLTSIREPLESMGRVGFELLIDRIENKSAKKAPSFVKLKPRLIERSSTGPRRAGAK